MENQKEITLPSGKVATIRKSKGVDIENTMKVIDGDQSRFITAYMAQCITIDNAPIVMEDLREMDGSDYMVLLQEFSTINFQ